MTKSPNATRIVGRRRFGFGAVGIALMLFMLFAQGGGGETIGHAQSSPATALPTPAATSVVRASLPFISAEEVHALYRIREWGHAD